MTSRTVPGVMLFKLCSYLLKELSYFKMLRTYAFAHAAFDAVACLAMPVCRYGIVIDPWI